MFWNWQVAGGRRQVTFRDNTLPVQTGDKAGGEVESGMTKPDHIHFFRGPRRRWVAQIFCDPNTCISWQVVGSMKHVKRIIRDQLTPAGIPFTIEEES